MNQAGWFLAAVSWMSMPVVALVAGILVWRKLHREFPFFFTYLLATEIATVVRFVTQFHGPWTYFYAFWISDLALGVFNVLVVYELFALRLFPRFYKVRFYRYLFAAVAAIIAAGGWFTAMESGDKYRALVIQARVVDFIIVAMLVFFISLMLAMGREWGKYDFAIAFGFVLVNAGALIASAMWVRTHYQRTIVDALAPLTYDVACLIWLYCFWSKERVFNRQAPLPLTPEMVQEARKWETVLKESISARKRAPRDAE